mgnify:FL=1
MKKYQLNKGFIELPDTWEDLSFRQKVLAFNLLKKVEQKTLSPILFRLQMLKEITGYEPQSGLFMYVLRWIAYIIRLPFLYIYYAIKLGQIRRKAYLEVWANKNRPQKPDRKIINYNLFVLSEKINFAFTLTDNTIVINTNFYKNPFPFFRIGEVKFVGRKFFRDIAPFTNISAKEYSDCFDLYMGFHKMNDLEQKERCIDKMISILYPVTNNYQENMVSDHIELLKQLDPGIKYGIFLWFSSIVEYYYKDPDYSILFRSAKEDSEESGISLGMNESVLMLEKNGYSTDKNINDFFDVQIKILKDRVATAVAEGVKKDKLAESMGLTLTDINRLL